MSAISKQDAIHALTRLGEIAASHGETVELLLVGGGAMVLLFDVRLSTKDLDVAILAPADTSKVREWARQLAFELSWPQDWLNDAAKGFLVGTVSEREVFRAPGISVCAPATEQLLAMKLCAWRDDVDIADARRLLTDLTGDYDLVWQRILPHLFPGRELTAKYAFDDLWESLHGND